MRRSLLLSLAAASAALLVPAGAHAAVLSNQPGEAISALGGTTVFNTEDAAGYHLTLHDSTGTRQLPVKASKIPFDVSLGTDSAGRPIAVYSRCRVGEDGWAKHDVVPGSCDLYAFDLAKGRERKLRDASRPGVSEGAPSIENGILVFGREFDLKAKAPRRLSYRTRVVIRREPGDHERTIMTIPGRDGGGYSYARDVDVDASAIHGERAAVVVYDPSQNASMLYLKTSGQSFRLLARGGFGEENVRQFESPTFAGRYLYFGYANHATWVWGPNGWVLRRDLRTGRTVAAQAPGYLEAVAADPQRASDPLVVSSFSDRETETGAPRGTDAVQTLDAPAWGAPPKIIHLR
jgi:hypothetical protein